MTKQEFIQQAALILLQHKYGESVDYLADYVKNYADAIYELCGQQQENPNPEVMAGCAADEPIENLLREIDRLDGESTRQLREKSSCYFQKGGYAAKVRRICENYDFVHVPNFIDFGKGFFEKERGIGEKCCAVVDQALKNLYNITSW